MLRNGSRLLAVGAATRLSRPPGLPPRVSPSPSPPARPAEPSAQRGLGWRPARVAKIDRLSDSNVVLRLEPTDGGRIHFDAGQFVYVRHEMEAGKPPLKSPYSIASPPYEEHFVELCVKRVPGGPMSSWVYDRRIGDTLTISRAFGGFHFASPPGRTAVFLATGTGVAPLRSMILDRIHQGDTRQLWLYYGVGREVNLVYADEFAGLSRQQGNFRFVPVVSRALPSWAGERGWVQEAFLHEFKGRRDYDAYVCGVKVMVDDVITLLRSEGATPDRIHFEKYV